MTRNARLRSMVLAGVFWGSLWGLYEATMGWIVHNLVRVPGASSVLLVPFAVFCMDRALRSGGTLRSVGIAAATAASLKLVDFLLPSLTLLSIVNPAVAIILEAVVFAAIVRLLGYPERRVDLPRAVAGAVAFSLGWRVLFLAFHAGLAAVWSVGMMRHGLQLPLGFLVRDGLLSAAAITAVLLLVNHRRWSTESPRLQPGVLTTALVVTVAVAAELATAYLG